MKKIFPFLCLLPCLFLTACLSSMQSFSFLNRVESYNAVRFKEFASHVPEHLQEANIMDKNNSWYEDKLTFANAETTKQIYNNLDYSFLPTMSKSKSLQEKRQTIEQKVKRTNVKTSANIFSFNEQDNYYKGEVVARLNWDKDTIKDIIVYFEEYSKDTLLASYYFVVTQLNKPIIPLIISKKSATASQYTVYVQSKKTNKVEVFDRGEIQVVEKPKTQANKENKNKNVKALSE